MDDEQKQQEDLAQYVIDHIQTDIDNIKEDYRGKATLILGMILDDLLICDSWYALNTEKYAYLKSVAEMLDIHAQKLGSPRLDVFHETKKAAYVMHELWETKDADGIERVVEFARRISKKPLKHADCYKNVTKT